MNGERFLLDTFFVIALLNQKDAYHEQAKTFSPRLEAASEVWITEAILVEIGNGLSAINYRAAAASFIKNCYQAPNIRVKTVDTPLLHRALQFYQDRPDKTWGLTDCISFVVMNEEGLTCAVTGDRHFQQAGYRTLLLND
jgi:uncharacterized protein